MRFQAFACDYDGTLAFLGRVAESTLLAVNNLRATGCQIILVTGRELEDLTCVFPGLGVCDYIVGENGGVLYHPATQATTLLAPPPPTRFVEELRQRAVSPLSVGKVLVATDRPYEALLQQIILSHGYKVQIIPNKDSLMVLPTGITKATGLTAVLKVMDVSPANVIGIGDAENDEDFLAMCGMSVAVANALHSVKAKVTWVTQGERGAGVEEVIAALLAGDR
jgi:hydroxymethylpyrimidine pyrophosphatase-like HAD family hydrolase